MSTNFASDPVVSKAAETQRQLAARAANLKIVDAKGFEEAAEWLKTVKSSLKQIEDARVRIAAPLNASLRELNSQAREAAAPFLETEAKIKASLLVFQRREDERRREEQRRLDQQAADRRAELERQEQAARAKAAREAQERREAAERAEAEGRAAEAERLRSAAARIEDKGQAKADSLAERAQAVVAPVVVAETPKVAGLTRRDNWVFTIKDKSKLPEAFKIADEVKIGKAVRSLKLEALDLLGGVEAIEIRNEPIVASAAR